MLATIAAIVATDDHGRVSPSEYLSPTAQPISSSPAITRITQAIRSDSFAARDMRIRCDMESDRMGIRSPSSSAACARSRTTRRSRPRSPSSVPSDFTFDTVRIDDLPLYNQDDDGSPSPQVTRLKGAISAAAGVIFVTPEYNRSIPGVLKNAIDHASRPYGQSAWTGKPAGVLGISIGPIGTACAQQHLRTMLAYLDMPTLGQPEVFLTAKEGFFDASGGHRQRGHAEVPPGLDGQVRRVREGAREVALTPRTSMAFPDWLEPMAATLTADRFTDPAWTFERKLDGIRVLAFKRGAEVELWSRNRLSLTAAYPAVAQALAALPHDTLILDGEATGGWGRQGKADYNVFDVLWIDGRDVRPLPLDERRAILKTLPLALPVARVTPLTGDAPWERACREGWEGVIAKRRDSPYEGKRSKAWLKMKCEASQELVVGGFTDPQRSRVGLGALLVGYFDGDDFVFAGKIGTGFDNALLRDLRARLDALERKTTPFTRATGLPKLRVHWVTPEIVVQAAFTEWTGGGKLRHPRLLGVRIDKSARDVVRERA